MKETFAIEAARSSVYPVGGGLWIIPLHPELVSTPYREWNSTRDIVRMPELCAARLGKLRQHRHYPKICQNAYGVLYALGANSGGLTSHIDDGNL
jgi:hypothetical protein